MLLKTKTFLLKNEMLTLLFERVTKSLAYSFKQYLAYCNFFICYLLF